MNKEEYLKLVRKEIKYVFDRDRIEKELNEHLQDSILDLIQDGYSYEDAQKQAINQMGDPIEVGKLLNKEHHPLFGYLYKMSQLIICILIIPLILHALAFTYSTVGLIFPDETTDYVEKISIDYKVELPGHTFIIDNVCVDERGECTLTYRTFKKISYSRSNWSVDIRSIKDSNNDYIDLSSGSTGGYLGVSSWINFTVPQDKIILLELPNNETITINLGEYNHD